MRPAQLDSFFAPISTLSGIGPKLLPLINALLGVQETDTDARIIDLLFHLPHSLIDRRLRPPISELQSGTIATLDVVVDAHKPPPRSRPNLPYRIQVSNDSGCLDLVYFHAKGDWLLRSLPVDSRQVISGRVDQFQGAWQMAHPDYVVRPDKIASLPLIEPIYPLTMGINNKTLRKAIKQALAGQHDLPEWIDEKTRAQYQWPSFMKALRTVHLPDNTLEWEPQSVARKRLAYDEFFAGQLALRIMRAHGVKAVGRAISVDTNLAAKARQHLPFNLTKAQEKAIADIRGDLFAEKRMLRLLQGDVGSGKTLVALFSALAMVEAGYQVALMVPTEVLARQHHTTLLSYAEATGFSIALLTGRDRSQHRKAVLSDLKEGRTDLVVGTQALFQESVIYQNLGLVIVDEQHRFGVHQRLALTAKGERVDMLVMTATPIPRTLMLAHFGDMDVSVLDEKPAGRLPITTAALPVSRIADIVSRLTTLIASGERAYWVCPLVEASEMLDVVSAEDRFAMLSEHFGAKVGLVHGRMSTADKDAMLKRFQSGDIHVLVATTVVEVGVDVPDATVIIIEHAERFGLSQLHQLRGRVGRSDKPSHCLLLYKPPLGDTATERLAIMRETNDGFRIAEADLRLRGGGELLGTRQSGMPDLKLAMIEHHQSLLSMAYDNAKACFDEGKSLDKTINEAERSLLYLFKRDAAVRLIQAG